MSIIEQADANYHSFPSFATWSGMIVNTKKWDKYSTRLRQEVEMASQDNLRGALALVRRVAAIETGAIENLYDADRGFTITAATTEAIWESAINAREGKKAGLLEAQLNAYDLILDFATNAVPITVSHIRELHKVICSSQTTYIAYTPIGSQEHSLPLGQYKEVSNHVLQPDGILHSYAPVHMTHSEMQRFCDELSTPEFLAAHSVLQASYAHYGLVVIHPFADGNGRVARALASVFVYRSDRVPLLITHDKRSEYFDALGVADQGHYQEGNCILDKPNYFDYNIGIL